MCILSMSSLDGSAISLTSKNGGQWSSPTMNTPMAQNLVICWRLQQVAETVTTFDIQKDNAQTHFDEFSTR